MSKTRTVKARCRCGHVLTITEGVHGLKAVCPSCLAIVRVRRAGGTAATRPRDSIAVTCICGHVFVTSAKQVGREVQCPSCGDTFTVPDPGEQWLGMYRSEHLQRTDEIPVDSAPPSADAKPAPGLPPKRRRS